MVCVCMYTYTHKAHTINLLKLYIVYTHTNFIAFCLHTNTHWCTLLTRHLIEIDYKNQPFTSQCYVGMFKIKLWRQISFTFSNFYFLLFGWGKPRVTSTGINPENWWESYKWTAFTWLLLSRDKPSIVVNCNKTKTRINSKPNYKFYPQTSGPQGTPASKRCIYGN